jgi:hypothetical protein
VAVDLTDSCNILIMISCKCDCNYLILSMNRLSLYSICALEHQPKAPKPGFDTDHSPHLVSPDSDELHTHSQTQLYLRNEPTAQVISRRTNGFFRHVFWQDITAEEANLDLSDLKYNPSRPRQAEELLESKLNRCIDSSSRSKFIGPSFRPFLHTVAR